MNYIPYTGSKDYFEQPLTNGDLVLLFDYSSGAAEVTCIQETDIGRLNLVPPSSRIGVTYGTTLDLVKIYASGSSFTGDTTLLFTNPNSTFVSQITDGVSNSIKVRIGQAQLAITVDSFAGKVLGVEYIPDGTGKFGCAIVTLLLYI